MIKFSKMHGLGNDFMVIDLVSQKLPKSQQATHCTSADESPSPANFSADVIQRWSDRRFGIGFDQLLLIEPPTKDNIDFRYRIYNADGNEVEQCGNGARCFAKYVFDKQLTPKRQINVETCNGDIVLVVKDDGQITVDMGPPRLNPQDLPFIADAPSILYPIDVEGNTFEINAVSMGNPHAVIVVDKIDDAPVDTIGPLLESHSRFPQRVNVGFVQIHNRSEISVRVFERGAGETFACGTGACAAVVAGSLRGLLDSHVTVHLRGGDLNISWVNDVNDDITHTSKQPVLMTGPANHVFDGEIDYDG